MLKYEDVLILLSIKFHLKYEKKKFKKIKIKI